MNAQIESLKIQDVRTLIDWAGEEGWNPGSADAEAFYAADPEGFIGCFQAGRLAAGISAVSYGPYFGFIGLYICHPDFRGQGYGMKVWEAGMKRLAGRPIGLDGVPEQQDNYARMGFAKSYETTRWSGSAAGLSNNAAHVVRFRPALLNAVLEFDRAFFPGPREAFLRAWLSPPRQIFVAMEGMKVTGYAVLRPCVEGFKVGPVFADELEVAVRLLAACRLAAGTTELHIDIPTYQSAFEAVLEAAGFVRGFETARMYLGLEPQVEKAGVFAVTTLELG